MDKKLIKSLRKDLSSIIKELCLASFKLPYEERFDVSSLRNNIYNVKVSGDIEYLNRFYESYVGSRLVNDFNYIKEHKPEAFITKTYQSVGELRNGINELVTKLYLEERKKEHSKKWVEKHLKPVVAYDRINIITMWRKENRNKETFKMVLFGNQERKGAIPALIIYTLLVLFGFVFMYPILYMLAYSFMSTADLINGNVNYVPTGLEWSNYFEAWKVLNYPKILGSTLLVSIIPAICQTVVCSLTGWGLARFKFKGSRVLFAIIIFTFFIPSCLTMLPTVRIYAQLHITGTPFAYIIPALLGQGFKSAVFILIFYQYFKGIPKAIIEASEIDGANTFKVFFHIGIPSAKSAILLTVLLSVVWYYNETVLASVFFGSAISTLPMGIENFEQSFIAMHTGTEGGKSINEAIYMAGTVLNILPLVILYIFTQRFFIQGVDKAGITGE